MTDPISSGPAVKASFAPVVSSDVRLLILGSLPGDASLRRGQYYGHPQNQFWRLMAGVLGAPLPADDYDARLAALLAAGVGLWDVVRTAERAGSLDAAIRRHQPNALRDLAASLPRLRAVAFNGGTAARLGAKQFGEAPLDDGREIELIPLPSSSPAYTLGFDRKLQAWLKLRAALAD
jgi:hypoxanthine-DNA glycosylase